MRARRTIESSTCALTAALLLCALAAGSRADDPEVVIDLAADRDDDDENGVEDCEDARPPLDDLRVYTPRARARGAARTVRFEGPLRVLVDGEPIPSGERVPASAELWIQGLRPGEGRVVVEQRATVETARIRVHGIDVEHAGARLSPTHDALAPSFGLPNDAAFVREDASAERAFRIHVTSALEASEIALRRIRRAPVVERERRSVTVPLRAPTTSRVSAPIRIVGASLDEDAPLAHARLVRALPGDYLDVELTTPTGTIAQSMRVARPTSERGPLAERAVRLALHIVDEGAVRQSHREIAALVARQVELSREIFAPCAITIEHDGPRFARIGTTSTLLVGDASGLPALGGELAIAVAGRALPIVSTRRGERAVDVARRIATTMREAGHDARLRVAPSATHGRDESADIVVHDPNGARLPISLLRSSEARLSIRVVEVDLADGLSSFDESSAPSGTDEERALVAALSDEDPHTLDVFVVERFARSARVGEAFVPRDGGPLAGTIILDLRALELTDLAFTLAHELAHVLLDMPLHPSDLGRTSSTTLLASGRARGDLRASRRVGEGECMRMRENLEARAR